MSRKKRTDSADAQQEIMQDAHLPPLEPPVGTLPDGARPYWEIIINGKARQFWTSQDLVFAAELAVNFYRTERLNSELLYESEVVETQSGPKPNPKGKIIHELVMRARTIAAFLKIHPEATQGKSRDMSKTNTAHSDALSILDDDDDGLIARPTH